MSCLVTVVGATGHVGKSLAEQLLNRGVRVRAVGRQRERLAPLVAKGAEVSVGDAGDASSLTKAFRGADAVFAMLPPDYAAPDMRAAQRRIAQCLTEAIRKSGVSHAAALSSIGAGLPSGTGPIAGLHEFEEMLKAISGLSVVILRAAYFMENQMASIPMIKSAGIIAGALHGDIALPMVATRDIAVTAASILSASKFEGVSTREVLGPRDYTMRETTTILGRAVGKPDLKYVEVGYDALRRALTGTGFSASVADGFVEMTDAFNKGRIQPTCKRTPSNTTPTTLEDFARDVFAPACRAA